MAEIIHKHKDFIFYDFKLQSTDADVFFLNVEYSGALFIGSI